MSKMSLLRYQSTPLLHHSSTTGFYFENPTLIIQVTHMTKGTQVFSFLHVEVVKKQFHLDACVLESAAQLKVNYHFKHEKRGCAVWACHTEDNWMLRGQARKRICSSDLFLMCWLRRGR